MSAPNFAKCNASKYFCFGFNQYFTQEYVDECELDQELVGQYDEVGTQINFDDTLGNVRWELKNKGWEEIEEYDNNYSYHSKFFAEKTIEFDFCNAHITIRARACATSAYYEGATFDWDGHLIVEGERYWDYNNGGEYDLPDYLDGLERLVVEDDWFDNIGLDKIHAKNVVVRIEQEFEKLTDEAEKVFQQYSERVLVCGGIFSNGEAIYYDADSLKGKANDIEAA
jgi:hypothetical protein